ncbi:MAG TPA: GNAT family N-acetyltransferase [Pyrinomonadaceae bacterium]|jgi:CelD/BcsL family acetyltransferase involved in cellulose biosynthesis
MELTEILTGGSEIIGKIFPEWTALCEEGASNQPFFRPEWFAAFVKNFENELMLLTVRRGGKLSAVLPLVKKKGSLHGVPARKLQAVFNANTQRFDLIHEADETRRKETVEALWKEIKKQKNWDVLEMRLVQKESWLKDLIALAESENYRTGIWQMDGAPFVRLPAGDDKEKLIADYFKNFSKNRRQILGKKLRRLEKLGKVEFCVTRGYSPELMQKYFALEAQSWKGRGGTDAGSDAKVARLHDDFARAVAARNALFIYELKLDGKTIAMYISIMYASETIGWKMSFDEEYARFSPGNLLLWEVLKGCIRNDSLELDMLSPATENKKFWASGEREHVAFYIFQRGVIGSMLWKWKFSVIKRLRKFKKNTPLKAAA